MDNCNYWRAPASYLTNVADDILETLIRLFDNGTPATIGFDAEGFEYYITIDFFDTFVIECKDVPKLYSFNIFAYDIANEVVCDIEKSIDELASWNIDCINDEYEELQEKENLNRLIDKLKRCLVEYRNKYRN